MNTDNKKPQLSPPDKAGVSFNLPVSGSENDGFVDDDNDGLDDNCPTCGEPYDEIDREYQICHLCKSRKMAIIHGKR